jgi:glycosyltransferase involved in cell wall biosynthesis
MRHSSPDLRLSVIIPVYNGGEKFGRCLLSLKESRRPPSEVIVVADGDTDDSWQVAKEFGTQVFRFHTPKGPARARNFGASCALGDVLFFVDADVMVPPDAIERVIGYFTREPDMDALFGSYDDQPAEPNFLSQYRNLLHHYVHQGGREDASTFWGACGAIRREVFLSAGGFDERYAKPSVEDIELGYRLRKAGARIKLCKSLQVKHLKRWDIVSMLQADVFQRALPWTELIFSERTLINDLNTSTSARLSVVLAFTSVILLFLSYWDPLALFGALGAVAMLLVLNRSLYRFFLQKRGFRFAIQSIFWHWLYFIYSGAAFAIGGLRHTFSQNGCQKMHSAHAQNRAKTTEPPRERR